MNKNFLVIVFFMSFCTIINGQEIFEKIYYKELNGKPYLNDTRAKFVELAINGTDDTLIYELRQISNNKLIALKKFKNEKPVGKWLFVDNFELQYNNKEYVGYLQFDLKKNTLKGEYSGEFEAPKFSLENNNFLMYVAKNLRYPEICAEKGIQGRIISQFIIDETGKIVDYSILNSANPDLDKEASRVILNSPIWKPARLNGEPIKVHIIMPTVFVLQ